MLGKIKSSVKLVVVYWLFSIVRLMMANLPSELLHSESLINFLSCVEHMTCLSL